MIDPPARRPRFTLRVLLFVVALVALIVSLINTYRIAQRNRLLEAENQRLRNEVGELSIEDETRFHAIQVPADNEFEWAWRIWIPEGHSYRVRVASGQIPKEGFPQSGGTLYLREAGEHVVRYRIRRDPRNNQWQGTLQTTGGSVGSGSHPWVEWNQRTATTGGVGTSTQSFPAGQPGQQIELARYRVSQASSSDKIEDPAAGFLIWLEPN
jgi:hypothetical protein